MVITKELYKHIVN